MVTSKCPLKVQISQGPGPPSQTELLKTGRAPLCARTPAGPKEAASSPRPGAVGAAAGEVPAHLSELLLAWFHCPVSTLALCLWLHWFELAAEVDRKYLAAGWDRDPCISNCSN